jgi:two-component system, OmpR family, sensor histidine kinase MtrB
MVVDAAPSLSEAAASVQELSPFRRRLQRAQTLLARFNKQRLGLRNRILAFYALGAFGLSMLLATTTFAFTRSTLLRQREDSATRQAYQNAEKVREQLLANPTAGSEALKSLNLPTGSNPILQRRSEWIVRTAKYGREALPASLRLRVVAEFTDAKMLSTWKGRPILTIGVPLSTLDASYFEVVELDELKRTLRSIGVSLIGAAAITTCLGVLLGSWAA